LSTHDDAFCRPETRRFGHRLARIARAAVAAGALGLPLAAQAQSYPVKPIRLVVTFPAGGATDIVARLLGAELHKSLGQSILVENRPGANGNIGADFVAKAPADGYTVLLADLSTFAIGPSLYPKLPFDPVADFAPITMVCVSPYGLAITANLPYKTLQDLIEFAKAHPGKLNYAHLGGGSASHLAAVEFGARTGTVSTYVPYKGGAPALTDVATGQSNMLSIATISTQAFVRSGKLRYLAMMNNTRMGIFPDVPTMAELGYPNFVAGQFQALNAPAGVPKDVITRLNEDTRKALDQPEVRKKLVDLGAEVIPGTPESLARFVADDRARWAKVVKEHNVKLD